jgi:hypothetical protein
MPTYQVALHGVFPAARLDDFNLADILLFVLSDISFILTRRSRSRSLAWSSFKILCA